MAYTTEQYEALKKAVATGTHSVSYGDKAVTYRSLSEMKELLSLMEGELFPERTPRRRRYACVDRGYYNSKR
jgi:hypothetical protein